MPEVGKELTFSFQKGGMPMRSAACPAKFRPRGT